MTLTGGGDPRTTDTDSNGELRFLNLTVGSYTLTTTLQGFSKVEPGNVFVNLSQNTDV